MMKFWNAASSSTFSECMPAMMPSTPMMPLPSSANASTHSGCSQRNSTNHTVTSSTPAPHTRPRAIAASR